MSASLVGSEMCIRDRLMQRFNADGSARASPRSPTFGHATSAPKRNRISPPRPSSPWLRRSTQRTPRR
eukprot:7143215-Alexandrium_andersonii.AAC.1